MEEYDYNDPCWHCNKDCSECEKIVAEQEEQKFRNLMDEIDEIIHPEPASQENEVQVSIRNIETAARRIAVLSKELTKAQI